MAQLTITALFRAAASRSCGHDAGAVRVVTAPSVAMIVVVRLMVVIITTASIVGMAIMIVMVIVIGMVTMIITAASRVLVTVIVLCRRRDRGWLIPIRV